MKMKNEIAIITGSTSGIGKTLAKLLLREGAKVTICSRNQEKVSHTLAELKEQYGDNVIGQVCDVSDPLAVQNLVNKTIEAFGGVRILVANAGFNLSYGPFDCFSLEEANKEANLVIGTNLIGVINSISAVLPQMKKQGYGRIITLAGGGADRPLEHMTIYSASKGGVLTFSKCLALEFDQNPDDIKLNIFFPGMIYTNLMRNTCVIEDWKDETEFREELDLMMKYVATDIEESCSKVIPYVQPSCKSNGKSFRGFSLFKLIRGFRKLRKERKRQLKS
jgi:NAD(P)-dependent dehydrogenase (short-subunit alcohol dehydrogenase family)